MHCVLACFPAARVRNVSSGIRVPSAHTQMAAPAPDESPLLTWWRLVHSPAVDGRQSPIIPTLVLLQENSTDVDNLKQSLPAQVCSQLHEFVDTAPAPGFPSLVYGSFMQLDPNCSVARFFSLFTTSRQVRIVVVPADEQDVVASFAAQMAAPIVAVRGWPDTAGAALNQQLETSRRCVVPPRFAAFCSLEPNPACLVLAGLASHHLALGVPGANIRLVHMTLKSAAAELHRWEYATRDVSLLVLESSFVESLDPSMYSTGLQGVLRRIVEDPKRRYQVVVLCGDGCVPRFKKLNCSRDQGWYSVVLPEDCEHRTVAASGTGAATKSPALAQHPLMKGFQLSPSQMRAVHGGPKLHHEDRVALERHMQDMRRRAAVGLTRSAVC